MLKRPVDYLGLVVGIWSLCYLGDELSKELVQNVRLALKDDGYFILNEPILEDKDKVNRFHDITDQQLLLRKLEWYLALFESKGLEVIHDEIHELKDHNAELSSDRLCTFILKKKKLNTPATGRDRIQSTVFSRPMADASWH